jgi:hypothetical protein
MDVHLPFGRRTYELHELFKLLMEIQKEHLMGETLAYIKYKVCTACCSWEIL